MLDQAAVLATREDDPERSGVRVHRTHAAAARRRRVLLVLLAAGVVSAVVGAFVEPMLWVSVADGVMTVGYLVAVARLRHLAVEREIAVAFAGPGGGFDWEAFDEPGSPAPREVVPEVVGDRDHVDASGADHLAFGRFLGAYLLGWALTPLAIAVRLLGGDRRDLEGDGVLARLVALQRHGREHSLKALAVSIATTAGVSAAGGLTGMAAAAPAVSASPAPGTYLVQAGDTLAAIAAAHGTTVAALVAANGIANPDVIYAGQRLVLGAGAAQQGSPGAPGAAPTTSAAAPTSYTVQAGDTLGSIAARYGTTTGALAAANRLADPDLIYIGQVLLIAGAASAGAPSAPTAPAGAQGGPRGSYTVRAGDTLGSIAARFQTTVAALAAANHLADPNLIYVGQVLSVDGAPAATTVPVGATTPPAPVVAPASSSRSAVAMSVALAQVGKPYQWAGAGPSAFDCSGLVMYAYEAAGVALAHYTVTQYQETERISEAELQPGDLVFYGGAAPSHVAMYVGGGQVVTADTTGTPVRVEPITWDGTPSGFGRVG